MTRYGRLSREPLFVPSVGPFRCGMRVQIPLPAGLPAKGRHGRDRVRGTCSPAMPKRRA